MLIFFFFWKKNLIVESYFYIELQITTARKAVTLFLSYLIFTKPLTEQHGTGLLLIAMGIILKMLPENKSPTNNRPNSHNNAKRRKSPEPEEKSLVETSGEDEENRPLV